VAPVAHRRIADNSFERFLELVGAAPIYVASRVADYAIDAAPAVEARLRRQFHSTDFVFARGLYLDTADWLRRWPTERNRYGGMILMTWANIVPEPYSGPRGKHAIGLGMMRELLDISRNRRPVLWLANEFPQWFNVARFSIEPPRGQQTACNFARLIEYRGAEPFKPRISPTIAALMDALGDG
jgi:hypothetical protein